MSQRSNALAERLERGARALEAFANGLTDAQWQMRLPKDGRKFGLDDEDLDRAAAVSLYSDAPVTCQFVLEDHAVRHSYHHLARLQAGLSA